MKATLSELLMRNFNEIFIELDPLKRAALLAESYTEDCLWIHPGGRVVVARVSMKRPPRFANTSQNIDTRSRVRSRSCTM
jgi:hypothetical protein